MMEIKTEPVSPGYPQISACDTTKQLGNLERITYFEPDESHSSDVEKHHCTSTTARSAGGPNNPGSMLEEQYHFPSDVVKTEETRTTVKVESIVKSEPHESQEEPIVQNNRPIHYVIVPSPNGTISLEKLHRFGLLCQQSEGGTKATVTLNGNNVTLISADGQTLGLVNNWNGNVESVRQSQNATAPGSERGIKPEATFIKTEDSSDTKTSLPTEKPAPEGTLSQAVQPENRLPGTSLVYRTPGANNMNKNGKVKRPMNAFMVWARMYRAKLAEAFPNITNSDVSIRLGQVWHEMTGEQKRPYFTEAERIKQRHKLQYPEWSYTPTQNRKRCEEPSMDTVAHNIYWARYGSGSMNAIQEASNNILKSDSGGLSGFVLSGPVYNQTSQPVINMTYLSNVYKPVPLNPPAEQQPVKVEVKTEKDTESTPAIKKETEKKQKTVKHSKDCPVSKESDTNTPGCTCPPKERKKRQRKPRSRLKDSKKEDDEKFPGGIQNDLRCQHLCGKLVDILPPSDEGALLLEDEYPSDPYNPFYFLNFGEEYEAEKDVGDVDVDRWRTYLGEKLTAAGGGLAEPGCNLNVFLSEARVSESATSMASSDLDIVPAPLATTLDRLRKSANSSSRLKSTSVGDGSILKCDKRPGVKTSNSKYRGQITAGNIPDTPIEHGHSEYEMPGIMSPNGEDLFVINEEVVVTTSETDHLRTNYVLGLDTDRGGAGDSIFPLATPKASLPTMGTFMGMLNQTDTPTNSSLKVSPPGKKPCV